jgi:glycosyltransferase involved in cell wall biosynthesis
MRIALDINGILENSGLGNHIRMLVRGLAAVDRENEYLLYLHQWGTGRLAGLGDALPKAANFSLLKLRVPDLPLMLAEHGLGLRVTDGLLAGRGIDVFHGPANLIPLTRRIPTVLTVHHYIGPGHEFFHGAAPWRQRFYFSATDASIKLAGHIITVSENTKTDVEAAFGVPPERVTAIHAGEPEIRPPAPDTAQKVRARYGLPEKFVLFSGPLNERKNLGGFLRAFASVHGRCPGLKLVVTGSGAPAFMAGIRELISALGLTEDVTFSGLVAKDDLPGLYAASEFLAYPSLFEGFGYPPLEAMICGTPVLASNVTSIPEIVGEAALLADPRSESSMAGAIERLYSDQALRRELVEKGRVRAAGFSWRSNAAETVKIYRKVYAARR